MIFGHSSLSHHLSSIKSKCVLTGSEFSCTELAMCSQALCRSEIAGSEALSNINCYEDCDFFEEEHWGEYSSHFIQTPWTISQPPTLTGRSGKRNIVHVGRRTCVLPYCSHNTLYGEAIAGTEIGCQPSEDLSALVRNRRSAWLECDWALASIFLVSMPLQMAWNRRVRVIAFVIRIIELDVDEWHFSPGKPAWWILNFFSLPGSHSSWCPVSSMHRESEMRILLRHWYWLFFCGSQKGSFARFQ